MDNNNETNDEAVKVVNFTVFIVGGVLILMILGLLIYFFVMRSKTIRINRKTMKKGPEHQMLSLVTVEHHHHQNANSISSPDKIMPMPYPNTVQVAIADSKNVSCSGD